MIRRWLNRRALVCREAVALMSDYIDGVLDARDRTRLDAHLAGCPLCTEYLAQLRTTIDALGHAEPADLSDEALGEFVEIYRLWRAG
jgi:anti-sigma factor RsiW